MSDHKLPSAAQLLETVNKLSYHQRVSHAANLGRKFHKDPKLPALIQELRQHPPPETPEVETDEGFNEILPSQSKNVAKHYDAEGVALFAAAASKNKAVLVEEVKNPSHFFKNLATREVVRQEDSDEALLDMIMKAVPVVQTKLIHRCIHFRRVALLDALVPKLLSVAGANYVATFIHGCSTPIVSEYILRNDELRNSTSLSWHKMCRYHGSVVISLLRSDLAEEKNVFQRGLVWTKWETFLTTGARKRGIKELLLNGGNSGAILKLVEEFPSYEFQGNLANGFPSNYAPGPGEFDPVKHAPWVTQTLPGIILNNLGHFVRRHTDEMFAWFERSVSLNFKEELRSSIPNNFWTLRNLSFKHVLHLVQTIASRATPNSVYGQQRFSLRTPEAARIPITILQILPLGMNNPKDYEKKFSKFGNILQVANNRIYFDLNDVKPQDAKDGKMKPSPAEQAHASLLKNEKGEAYLEMDRQTVTVHLVWGSQRLGHNYRSFGQGQSLDGLLLQQFLTNLFTDRTASEVKQLLEVGFNMIQHLNPKAPEGDLNLAQWRRYTSTLVSNAIRHCTTYKVPSWSERQEGKEKKDWKNPFLECIEYIHTRAASLYQSGLDGYPIRIAKLKKMYEISKSLIVNQNSVSDKERANANLNPSALMRSRLAAAHTAVLHVSEAQGEMCASVDALERVWEALVNDLYDQKLHVRKIVLGTAALDHLGEISRLINGRLNSELDAIRSYYNSQKTFAEGTIQRNAYRPDQLKVVLKLILDWMIVTRPVHRYGDLFLVLWRTNLVSVLTNLFSTYASCHEYGPVSLLTIEERKRKDLFSEHRKLVLEYIYKVFDQWTSDFETTLPQRVEALKKIEEEVTAIIEKGMHGKTFALVLPEEINPKAPKETYAEAMIRVAIAELRKHIGQLTTDFSQVPSTSVVEIAAEWKGVQELLKDELSERSLRVLDGLRVQVLKRIVEEKETIRQEQYLGQGKFTETWNALMRHSDDQKGFEILPPSAILTGFKSSYQRLQKLCPTERGSLGQRWFARWRDQMFDYHRKTFQKFLKVNIRLDRLRFEGIIPFFWEQFINWIATDYRRGQDEGQKKLEQLLEEVTAYLKEQEAVAPTDEPDTKITDSPKKKGVKRKKAPKKKEKLEPLDVEISRFLTWLEENLNDSEKISDYESIISDWNEFVKFAARNPRMGRVATGRSQPKLGSIMVPSNLGLFRQYHEGLKDAVDKARNAVRKADENFLSAMFAGGSSFLTLFDRDPERSMTLFKKVFPVFAASQPSPATEDKDRGRLGTWPKTLESIATSLLKHFDNYRLLAKTKEEQEKKKEETKEDVVMSDQEPSEFSEVEEKFLPSSTVAKFQQEVLEFFYDQFVAEEDHIPFTTFAVKLLRYSDPDKFAELYKKLGEEQPFQHISALIELMTETDVVLNHEKNWWIIFESFKHMPDPPEQLPYLIKAIPSATPDQRCAIFKGFSHDSLNALAQTKPTQLIMLMQSLHAEPSEVLLELRIAVSEWLAPLLNPDPEDEDAIKLSEATADELLKYQDINDTKIRATLTKAADSNSQAQREAALENLVIATLLAGKEQQHAQCMRTLKYLIKKNKNQALENRAKTLEILLKPHAALDIFLSNAEYLPIWSEMLSDALEAQDLDEKGNAEYTQGPNHEVLKYFYQVSEKALALGAHDCEGNPLWKFGVDIQWRIAVFRLGEKKAAEEFVLRLPAALTQRGQHCDRDPDDYFPASAEKQFIDGYLKAYETCVKDRVPNYLQYTGNAFKYYKPLFSIIGKNSDQYPVLMEFLESTWKEFPWRMKTREEKLEKLEAEDKENAETRLDEENFVSIDEITTMIQSILKPAKDFETRPWLQKLVPFLFEVLLKVPTIYVRGSTDELTPEYQFYEQVEQFTFKLWQFLLGLYYQHQRQPKDIKQTEYLGPCTLPFFTEFAGKIIDFVRDKDRSYDIVGPFDTWVKESFQSGDWNGRGQPNSVMEKYPLTEKFYEAYTKMLERTPSHSDSSDYPDHVKVIFAAFSSLRIKWWEDKYTIDLGGKILDLLEKCELKDDEGLLGLNKGDAIIILFRKIIKGLRGQTDPYWHGIPLLRRFVDIVMRSRQAMLVYPVFWRSRVMSATNAAEKWKLRNAAIEELLSISKSAIHIRVVWRHLVKHRQDLLDPFINSGNAFRGVFYIDPEQRKLKKEEKDKIKKEKQEARQAALAAKSGKPQRGKAPQKGPQRGPQRGRPAPRGPKGPPPARGRGRGRGRPQRAPPAPEDSGKFQIDKERKAEKKFQEEKVTWLDRMQKKAKADKEAKEKAAKEKAEKEAEKAKAKAEKGGDKKDGKKAKKGSSKDEKKEEKKEKKTDVPMETEEAEEPIIFDHQEMFCIEGCYDLHRLLPRQAKELAVQRKSQVLNPDRPLPERVAATIRWTLLPYIDYPDVVKFEQSDPKMPVNLVEALLKGILESDEPCAPMHYLLSPKFLSSDRSRIAAYAISKVVPYIPRSKFSKLLRVVLTGERRNALKVTAYKEVIRLLLKEPTQAHVKMIVHEWKRAQLHRDVRITILQAAFVFLQKSQEIPYAAEAAWEIFESAVTNPDVASNTEILTAILGALGEPPAEPEFYTRAPKQLSELKGVLQGITLKPRLIDHLVTFNDYKVPLRHCVRFAKNVVIKLCLRVHTQAIAEAKELAEKKKKAERERQAKEKKAKEAKKGDEMEDVETKEEGKAKKGTKKGTKKEEKVEVKEESEAAMEVETKEAPMEVEAKDAGRSMDDLAYLAMFLLPRWIDYGIKEEAAEILRGVVADVTPEFLENEKIDVRAVNNQRWDVARDLLLRICGLTAESRDSRKLRSHVAQVIQTLADTMKSYATGQREIRLSLKTRLESFIQAIPVLGHDKHSIISPEEEETYMKPLLGLGNVFLPLYLIRRAQRLHLEIKGMPDYIEKAQPLLHQMIDYATSTLAYNETAHARLTENALVLLSRGPGFDYFKGGTALVPYDVIAALMSERLVRHTTQPSFAYTLFSRGVTMGILKKYPTFIAEKKEYTTQTQAFIERGLDLIAEDYLEEKDAAVCDLGQSYHPLLDIFGYYHPDVSKALEARALLAEYFFEKTKSLMDEAPKSVRAVIYAHFLCDLLDPTGNSTLAKQMYKAFPQFADVLDLLVKISVEQIADVTQLVPCVNFSVDKLQTLVNLYCNEHSPYRKARESNVNFKNQLGKPAIGLVKHILSQAFKIGAKSHAARTKIDKVYLKLALNFANNLDLVILSAPDWLPPLLDAILQRGITPEEASGDEKVKTNEDKIEENAQTGMQFVQNVVNYYHPQRGDSPMPSLDEQAARLVNYVIAQRNNFPTLTEAKFDPRIWGLHIITNKLLITDPLILYAVGPSNLSKLISNLIVWGVRLTLQGKEQKNVTEATLEYKAESTLASHEDTVLRVIENLAKILSPHYKSTTTTGYVFPLDVTVRGIVTDIIKSGLSHDYKGLIPSRCLPLSYAFHRLAMNLLEEHPLLVAKSDLSHLSPLFERAFEELRYKQNESKAPFIDTTPFFKLLVTVSNNLKTEWEAKRDVPKEIGKLVGEIVLRGVGKETGGVLDKLMSLFSSRSEEKKVETNLPTTDLVYQQAALDILKFPALLGSAAPLQVTHLIRFAVGAMSNKQLTNRASVCESIVAITKFFNPSYASEKSLDHASRALVENIIQTALELTESKEAKSTPKPSLITSYQSVLRDLIIKETVLVLIVLKTEKIKTVFQFLINEFPTTPRNQVWSVLEFLNNNLAPNHVQDRAVHPVICDIINDIITAGITFRSNPSHVLETSWTPQRLCAGLSDELFSRQELLVLSVLTDAHRKDIDHKTPLPQLVSLFHLEVHLAAQRGAAQADLSVKFTRILNTLQKYTMEEDDEKLSREQLAKFKQQNKVRLQRTTPEVMALLEVCIRQKLSSHVVSPMYRRILTQITLDLLSSYQLFSQENKRALAMEFIHLVTLHCVRRVDDASKFAKKLKQEIIRGIEWERSLEEELRMEEDDTWTAPKVVIYSDAMIKKIVRWINGLQDLRSFSTVPPSAMKPYRSFLGMLALELLVHYGNLTPKPVESTSKGGSVETTLKWRPELIKLLDAFSSDEEPNIQYVALSVVIEQTPLHSFRRPSVLALLSARK